jgi:hypothetical protein
VSALVPGQHVGLVDEEQILLVRVDFGNVLGHVIAAERERRAAVDNLHHHVTAEE